MALPGGCLVKMSLARDLVGEKERWKKIEKKIKKIGSCVGSNHCDVQLSWDKICGMPRGVLQNVLSKWPDPLYDKAFQKKNGTWHSDRIVALRKLKDLKAWIVEKRWKHKWSGCTLAALVRPPALEFWLGQASPMFLTWTATFSLWFAEAVIRMWPNPWDLFRNTASFGITQLASVCVFIDFIYSPRAPWHMGRGQPTDQSTSLAHKSLSNIL